jgi:AbrB family looped-hinge helix DNA binding protein
MSVSTEPVVEYLTTTRIGEKGQLTVPKEYRDSLGLGPGAPVAVLRVGDGLILMPEQARFNEMCDSIASALEDVGVSEAALQSTLPAIRTRIFAHRYSKLAKQQAKSKAKKR